MPAEQKSRQVATIAPAPDTDLLPVHVVQALHQVGDHGGQVPRLQLPQLTVHALPVLLALRVRSYLIWSELEAKIVAGSRTFTKLGRD